MMLPMISSDKKNFLADKDFQDKEMSKAGRYARNGIIIVLIEMIVALRICVTTTINWCDTKMHREVDIYEHQLIDWIDKQHGILSMFVNLLSEHPEFINDYPSAVKFLNDLTKHYPEISVCYMANPYKEHLIIMNNGWEASYCVENRKYIDTIKAKRATSAFRRFIMTISRDFIA